VCYAGIMKYCNGGGLTAKERAHRRADATGRGWADREAGVSGHEVARRLQGSRLPGEPIPADPTSPHQRATEPERTADQGVGELDRFGLS
jgi:hypothetical protein